MRIGDIAIQLNDGGAITEDINSEIKAEYVQEALEGRNLNQNQTVSISVPLRNDMTREALEDDREQQEMTDIGTIRDAIDELVFDLYGIEDQGKRVLMQRYTTQYKEVRSLNE